MAERITISVPEGVVEDFDHILDVKEMKGELDSDSRSPVLTDLMRDYINDNREDLEKWEAFAEGNSIRTRPMAAD